MRRMQEKTGKYPVVLKVTHNRVSKEFATVFDLSEDDYNKMSAPRISKDLQDIREKIKEIISKAGKYIDENQPFAFDDFERNFILSNHFFKERKVKLLNTGKEGTTISAFDFSPYLKRFPIFEEDHSRYGCISASFFSYIKRLLEEDRIGTALSMHNSFQRLKEFRGNVLLSEITPGFLFQFEKHMLAKDRSLGYVSILIRDLRTVFNDAIAEKIIRQDLYPFGKRKYIIPKSRNVKRAINIQEIGDLYYYKTDDINEQKALAYWMFCYFGNGMNPKDMANLKFKNVHGDYFTFNRAKTILTSRADPRPITVFLNDDMKAILQKWGNSDCSPDNYLFPILEKSMTAIEQHYIIRGLVHFINIRMKKIGESLGISKKITTVVSRHSFSTQLKRSGASTEFIQESLGHTDKATTENYLDSFENEIKKQYSESLTAFKKDRLFIK